MSDPICVLISRSLDRKNKAVAYLTSRGFDAFGDRLLLGEYGIYVAGPAPLGLTEEIESALGPEQIHG